MTYTYFTLFFAEENSKADKDLERLQVEYSAVGFTDYYGYDKEAGIPYIRFMTSEKPLTHALLSIRYRNLTFVEFRQIKTRKNWKVETGEFKIHYKSSLEEFLRKNPS